MSKPLTNPNGPYPIYDSPTGLPPKGTPHFYEALPAVSRPAVDPFKNEPEPKKKGGKSRQKTRRSRKSKRRR
jgi:hypothetical protein